MCAQTGYRLMKILHIRPPVHFPFTQVRTFLRESAVCRISVSISNRESCNTSLLVICFIVGVEVNVVHVPLRLIFFSLSFFLKSIRVPRSVCANSVPQLRFRGLMIYLLYCRTQFYASLLYKYPISSPMMREGRLLPHMASVSLIFLFLCRWLRKKYRLYSSIRTYLALTKHAARLLSKLNISVIVS